MVPPPGFGPCRSRRAARRARAASALIANRACIMWPSDPPKNVCATPPQRRSPAVGAPQGRAEEPQSVFRVPQVALFSRRVSIAPHGGRTRPVHRAPADVLRGRTAAEGEDGVDDFAFSTGEAVPGALAHRCDWSRSLVRLQSHVNPAPAAASRVELRLDRGVPWNRFRWRLHGRRLTAPDSAGVSAAGFCR